MPIDLAAVGRTWTFSRSWTGTDALLYALGVGAGAQDPLTELEFTTENSHDVVQRVLPTFAAVLPGGPGVSVGDYDVSQVLHGEQSVTVHGPLPVSGDVSIATEVTGIYDKTHAALVRTSSSIMDGDALLATVDTGMFVRGEGGFGGSRGTSVPW